MLDALRNISILNHFLQNVTCSMWDLVIGGDHFGIGKKNFQGTIDEVRIYNRALNTEEVKELYLFTSAFPPAE